MQEILVSVLTPCYNSAKTIEKTLNRFSNIDCIKLTVEEFNSIVSADNCKLLAIKNKGISEQVLKILRGENGR